MSKSQQYSRRRQGVSPAVIGALIGLVVLVILGGCLCWAIYTGISSTAELFEDGGDDDVPPVGDVLRLAYSPEKEALFSQLVEAYNKAGYETADGRTIRVQPIRMEPEAMLQGALNGRAHIDEQTD